MLLIHNIMVVVSKKKNEKHLIEHTSFIILFTHCYLQYVVQFKQFIGAIVAPSITRTVTKISSYVNRTTGKFFKLVLFFFCLLWI